jgi:hypothetical protein
MADTLIPELFISYAPSPTSDFASLAQEALDLVWSALSRGKASLTPRQFSIRLKKMSLGTPRPPRIPFPAAKPATLACIPPRASRQQNRGHHPSA